MELIIGLLSGAAGGNIAAKILKQFDLGLLGNSIAGILGGGIGSQVLGVLLGGAGGGGMDIGGIIGSIASGGIGGGVLLAIVGVIRSAIKK